MKNSHKNFYFKYIYPLHIKIVELKYKTLYDNVGNIDQVYWINPFEIKHSISDNLYGKRIPVFEIRGGNWDRNKIELNQNTYYHQRFSEGVEWETTESYQNIVTDLRKGEGYSGLDTPGRTSSPQDFRSYLNYLDNLYEDISENGYKTQDELNNAAEFSNTLKPPELNEIQVCIDRKGQFIISSGKHRLAIAKSLDLDEIPVRTRVRHTKWQQMRDSIYNGNDKISNKYINHPEIDN